MEAGKEDIIIRITAHIDRLKQSIASAKTQISGLAKSVTASSATMLRNTSEHMRRLGNTLVGAAGSALVGFVNPVVNGFKSIIKAGMEMEDSIQRVMSVFDGVKTPAVFEKTKAELEGFVSSLAGTTKFDFNEISEAIYSMAQAGQDYNAITAITPKILELATAQMTDVDSTAQLVISTMNAYGIEIKDVARITNAYAAANSATMLTMQDMIVAAQYTNSTLSTLWGDEVLERGLAMTGLLRDMGYTGEKSGRIIRDIFLSLLNPSAEVNRIMERNNINIYKNSDAINALKRQYADAEATLTSMTNSGTATSDQLIDQKLLVKQLGYELENTYSTGLIGLDEVLQEFANARDAGMTVGELFAFGGKQSGGAIAAIVDNLPRYQAYVDAITDTNEAEEQADTISKSVAYTIGLLRSETIELSRVLYYELKAALQEVALEIIDLMPVIKDIGMLFITGMADKIKFVADKIISLVKWFNGLDSSIKKIIVTFTTTAVAIMMVVAPIMLLSGIIVWLSSSVVGFMATLMKLTEGLTLSRIATKLFGTTNLHTAGTLTLMQKATYGTTLRLGALKTKLAGLVVTEKIFNDRFSATSTMLRGKYSTGLKSVKDNTKLLMTSGFTPLLTKGFDALKNKIPILTTGLTEISGTLTAAVIPAILTTVVSLAPLILTIGAVIAAVVVLYVAIRDNWQGIGDIFKKGVDYTIGILKPFLDAIDNVKSAMGTLFEAIKGGTASDIMSGLGEVIGGVIRFIFSIPYTIIAGLIDILGQVVGIVIRWLGAVGDAAAEKGVVAFLKGILEALIAGAIKLGKAFLGGLLKGLMGESADDKVIDAISDSDKMKAKGEEDGIDYGDGFIDGTAGLKDYLESLTDDGIEYGDGFIDGTAGFEDYTESLTEYKKAKADEFKSIVDAGWSVDEKFLDVIPKDYEKLSVGAQAKIRDINKTAHVYRPNIGDYSDSYMMNREGYEGLTKQEAYDKDMAHYRSETVRIRADMIKEAIRLHTPKVKTPEPPEPIPGPVPGTYIVSAKPLCDLVDAAVDTAVETVESKENTTKIKTAGAKTSEIYGDGIVEDSENLDAKVKTINETVDTNMTEMTTSAFSYGENFMIKLINGIDSQFSAFVDRVNSIKLKMSELEFYGNTGIDFDSTKFASDIAASIVSGFSAITATPLSASNTVNINITGNTFTNETGMDASDIGNMVDINVQNALKKVNRSNVIV